MSHAVVTLPDSESWTSTAMARDAEGETVDEYSLDACSFCLMTAIRRSTFLASLFASIEKHDDVASAVARLKAYDDVGTAVASKAYDLFPILRPSEELFPPNLEPKPGDAPEALITRWNDAPERTHGEALEVLREVRKEAAA